MSSPKSPIAAPLFLFDSSLLCHLEKYDALYSYSYFYLCILNRAINK
ncbi:predicted protein [Histoplasma mississippiense (nom. inval.)]|nr:predicted protein [Histoplasma mississippiense (nom. inval.)]EDN02606.1 predicted protein [Histoplasma mississippiense (nom. inval.)]